MLHITSCTYPNRETLHPSLTIVKEPHPPLPLYFTIQNSMDAGRNIQGLYYRGSAIAFSHCASYGLVTLPAAIRYSISDRRLLLAAQSHSICLKSVETFYVKC
eukprot:Filipodium_phascolosomae@DN4250_c0_g1_i1.p1